MPTLRQIQCSTAAIEHPRLHRNAFRGEPAISELDWLFTPTHRSSHAIAAATGSGLRTVSDGLTLPMGSSPGFGSTAGDSTPYSNSLSLRLRRKHGLASPPTVTRRLLLPKARRHHSGYSSARWVSPVWLRQFCRHAVSGSSSLPCRGSFHRSLTVLCAIGSQEYLALEGGPPGFPQAFTFPVVLR